MNSSDELVRAAIGEYLEAAVPDDLDLLPKVRARLSGSAGADVAAAVPDRACILPGVRGRLARRRRACRRGGQNRVVRVMLGVVAASIATSVSAFAAAETNFPIEMNLIRMPAPWTHAPPTKQAGERSLTIHDSAPISLPAAKAEFGHPVVTVDHRFSQARLQAAYYDPGKSAGADPKLGDQAQAASVSVVYSYAGTTAELDERFDPSSSPLGVTAVDEGGPKIKTLDPSRQAFGLTPADVETVGESRYLVVYSGSWIYEMRWKTSSGVVVNLWFAHPVDRAVALALVSNLH